MTPSDGDDSQRRRVRESDVGDLLASLDAEDQQVRNAASMELARRAEEEPDLTMDHLPALVSSLNHGDAVVRSQVSAAVGQLAEREPDALVDQVPALVDRLDDDSRLVRRNVLEALFEVAKTDPDAVEPATDELVAQLDLVTAFVRTRAIHVLMHVARDTPMTVEAHIPELVGHLQDEREEPDRELGRGNVSPSVPAHERLQDPFQQVSEDERLRWQSFREGIALILATLAPHRPERYEAHVSDLVSLLTDDSMLVRKSVVEILGCIAEDDASEVRSAVPELLDRLYDDDAEIVRARAAWALAAVSVEASAVTEEVSTDLSPIADLLESDDVEVRTAAATLLGAVAETYPDRVASLRPEVSRLLEDESDAVRRQAAWVFAFLGDEDARKRLETLRDGDPDPEIRDLAAELVQSMEADDGLPR